MIKGRTNFNNRHTFSKAQPGSSLVTWINRRNLLAAMVLVLIAAIVYLPWLRVKSVVVIGANVPQLEATIPGLIQQQIYGYKYGFIPADSFFVIDESELSDSVRKAWPKVASATIEYELPSTLVVNLVNNNVIAYWQSNLKLFEVDETGKLVGQVASVPSDGLTLTDTTSLQEYVIGDVVVGTEVLTAAKQIGEAVNKAGLVKITHFDISEHQNFQLRAYTNLGWYIMFSIHENLDTQLSKLSFFLTEAKKTKPLDKNSFNYVDVRFGADRIYYK